MWSCATALITSLVLSGAVASAQTTPSTPLSDANTRTSVTAGVHNYECDRMRWEAQQTWSAPSVLGREDPGDQHVIHIETGNQPELVLPRLRREWLQASSEAAASTSGSDLRPPHAAPLDFLSKQHRAAAHGR